MDLTIVLFIVGGLSASLVALFGWLIHSYEGRISRLEKGREEDKERLRMFELQISNRLASIEAKLEKLIER